MSVFDIWEIPGFETSEPCKRILRLVTSPETTGTRELSLILAIIPPKSTTCLHSHSESSEWMYIISGKGECILNNNKLTIGPDMLIYAPKGVEHEIKNTGDETMKILAIFIPPLSPSGSYKELIEITKEKIGSKGC